MRKLRIWLVNKIIGEIPYINNVKFYQTVCLDIDSRVYVKSAVVELGHSIKWQDKNDDIAFYLGRYKEDIAKKNECK
jgi:hypothetical protein